MEVLYLCRQIEATAVGAGFILTQPLTGDNRLLELMGHAVSRNGKGASLECVTAGSTNAPLYKLIRIEIPRWF
ncbi:MAG: hypothetical protein KBG09_01260 [Syntrophobacterales bacterium]|nr:hypothetical protein [Syntrophobacterales bacterium]